MTRQQLIGELIEWHQWDIDNMKITQNYTAADWQKLEDGYFQNYTAGQLIDKYNSLYPEGTIDFIEV